VIQQNSGTRRHGALNGTAHDGAVTVILAARAIVHVLHTGLHERLFGRERNAHRGPKGKTQGQHEHSNSAREFHSPTMDVRPKFVNSTSWKAKQVTVIIS
jgi:hypothetical protein